MDWLRLYTDILDDEKIVKLSDTQYRIFTYLMLMAREKDQNGSFTYDPLAISWRLRRPKNQIENAVKKLNELGIITIENNILTFINWSKRQYKSDDVNARVKRYRQKSETLQPTLESRAEQKQNRAEAEQRKNETPASFKKEESFPEESEPSEREKKKIDFMSNLESAISETRSRYPRHRDQQEIMVFIQANIHNKHPDAILHCIHSLVKAPEIVKSIPAYLNATLKIENGKYNARDEETMNNEFKKYNINDFLDNIKPEVNHA